MTFAILKSDLKIENKSPTNAMMCASTLETQLCETEIVCHTTEDFITKHNVIDEDSSILQ